MGLRGCVRRTGFRTGIRYSTDLRQPLITRAAHLAGTRSVLSVCEGLAVGPQALGMVRLTQQTIFSEQQSKPLVKSASSEFFNKTVFKAYGDRIL